jgi:antitoxin (DNA-binding transcriptional repressor) of toxin-antitoxin stability system
MEVVNMLQAKSTLSRLVEAIEQESEREIVIPRGARPVAKLASLESIPTGKRIGVARGVFEVPGSIDEHSKEIAELFLGGGHS